MSTIKPTMLLAQAQQQTAPKVVRQEQDSITPSLVDSWKQSGSNNSASLQQEKETLLKMKAQKTELTETISTLKQTISTEQKNRANSAKKYARDYYEKILTQKITAKTDIEKQALHAESQYKDAVLQTELAEEPYQSQLNRNHDQFYKENKIKFDTFAATQDEILKKMNADPKFSSAFKHQKAVYAQKEKSEAAILEQKQREFLNKNPLKQTYLKQLSTLEQQLQKLDESIPAAEARIKTLEAEAEPFSKMMQLTNPERPATKVQNWFQFKGE